MSEANNKPSAKSDDGFQAVPVEELKQIEGGDATLVSGSPVGVSGPLMDCYLQYPRGSNNRLG